MLMIITGNNAGSTEQIFFLDKSNDFAKVPDIIIKLRNDMDPLPLEAAC